MKQIIIFFMIVITTLNANTGEELFNKHCYDCHAVIVGLDEQNGETTYITENAPYIKDLIKKLKTKLRTKEDFGLFIKDYINEPYEKKSIYGKKAIKKFGLMKSLKGVMSEDEVKKLSDYLYKDYGNTKVKKKEVIVKKISLGEELFNKHCTSCHTSVIGIQVGNNGNDDTKFITDKAPYIKDVLIKIKQKINTKDGFINVIKNYIKNPNRKKSLYGKKAVNEFDNAMPSFEKSINSEAAREIGLYLYNYKLD